MRPEAVVFVIALAVVVVFALIKRLARREPVDERRDHPFPYATPGQYVFGPALAALNVLAAGIGRAAILGGRVVTRAWPGGHHKGAA